MILKPVGYMVTTAAAVAAAKTGMPHIIQPYVDQIQHVANIISQIGGKP